MGDIDARIGLRTQDRYAIFCFLQNYFELQTNASAAPVEKIILINEQFQKVDFELWFSTKDIYVYQVKGGMRLSLTKVTEILDDFIALKREIPYKDSKLFIIFRNSVQCKWLIHFRNFLSDYHGSSKKSVDIMKYIDNKRIASTLNSYAELFGALNIKFIDEGELINSAFGFLHRMPTISKSVTKRELEDFYLKLQKVIFDKIADKKFVFYKEEFEKLCRELNNEPDERGQIVALLQKTLSKLPTKIQAAPVMYNEGKQYESKKS